MILEKIKKLSILSIVSFFVMSVDFMIMPINNNVEKNMRWFDIFTGLIFWIFLIIGIVLQVTISRMYKKNTIEASNNKLNCGVISFFKNKIAIIFDSSFIIGFISFVIMMFVDSTSYICYVLLSVITFSFCMHCILNGRIYNSTFFEK